jgi:hypothetical protein
MPKYILISGGGSGGGGSGDDDGENDVMILIIMMTKTQGSLSSWFGFNCVSSKKSNTCG